MTEEQMEILKGMVPAQASENEFKRLVYLSEKYGLDPIAKEVIIGVLKGGDAQVMITRDGHLRAAQNHPDYQGVNSGVIYQDDEYILDAANNVFKVTQGKVQGAVIAGWAIAKAKGRDPIICIANFQEYYEANKNSSHWREFPSAMIQKTAEIMAIKRQFNINGMVGVEEIEGKLGTPEEMLSAKPEAKAEAKPEAKAEVGTDSAYIILVIADGVINDNAVTSEAVVYEPKGEDTVKILVAPKKFEALIKAGAALKATGEDKDGVLKISKIEKITSLKPEGKQKAEKPEEKTESAGKTEKSKPKMIVTITSAPKKQRFPYKGETYLKPCVECQNPNHEGRCFLVGEVVAELKPGDKVLIKKLAGKIKKNDTLVLLANQVEVIV